MSFNYTSPSGIRLDADAEEPLLESIDNSNHPLNGCANLGDLHRQLNGDGVVLSDQTPMVDRQFNISEQERNEIMDTLKVRIDELNKSIANKSEELNVARKSRNCDLAHILGKEIEELGRQRKAVLDQFDIFKKAEPHNGSYLVQASVLILGKYDSFTKEVVLYRKSISSKNLLAIVYVHEMMHAYLDCGGITLPEIEEPIVEYAMLNFFNAFDNSICFEAKNHVKEKQQVIGIAHYGFGYCIFKNPNGINWLEDYRNAKISLVKTDPNVAAYLDYWKTGIYPEKKEKECLVALYKALHHGTTIHISVRQENFRRVRRRNYTINGKGSYSMYEVVEEFVKFLQGQGNTIGTINQEIQNYINSGWIFVSSNPGKVAWSNEKGEYSSLSGFYITKQWKGNANGNFTRLIDIINQRYKSFQIVEI